MPKTNKKKICIVVSSLGRGGAERSSGLLSKMLFDARFDVHVVSVLNYIEYPYKGKLLNLGELKDQNDSIFGRWNRLWVLKRYLKTHQFDYVIDNRSRIGFVKEFIISKFIYNSNKTIYCIRSYKIDNYLHPNKILARLIYKNAKQIVSVSKLITAQVKKRYNFENLSTIYNAVYLEEQSETPLGLYRNDENYILFFGRIDDDVKNISLLLEAYSQSKLPSRQITLKILGDGKDVDKLKKRTADLKISSYVEFLPHNPNPSAIIKKAHFTLLTSRYEGFPRSIMESLALGTPVISVDCKSGPNELIQNKHNGLLVENYNAQALSDAMNLFLEDKDLYLFCKSNSKPSMETFAEEEILKQWELLLN